MERDERLKVRGYSLPPEQIEWLVAEARARNRSVSNMLRCIVEDAMQQSRAENPMPGSGDIEDTGREGAQS